MTNAELSMTLDQAVEEVLGLLTGLDLTYTPELDRYRAVTRQLNRALRSVALEQEWGYYASIESCGPAVTGEVAVSLRSSVRPRIINDDAVRLVDAEDGIVAWAYFLPRDALHKYAHSAKLYCTATRTTLAFNRAFTAAENGLDIQVPVMREPKMFRLPATPEDPGTASDPVDQATRDQEVDFEYPDLVVLKAAYFVAQSDPVMQPRVQQMEQDYKDLMYQIMERDERNTETPYANPFLLPVSGELTGTDLNTHRHPTADF